MKNELEFRINWEIKSEMVRMVGDNVENIIQPLKQAIYIAKEQGLDLVEINNNVSPVICKVIDYNKFIYDQKKRQKEQDKKNRMNLSEMKEMRFTPSIGDNDYETKKKHIISFINDGDKVKAIVVFKGRENKYQDKGQIILLKLADELSNIATVEKLPTIEGNKMILIIKPKK